MKRLRRKKNTTSLKIATVWMVKTGHSTTHHPPMLIQSILILLVVCTHKRHIKASEVTKPQPLLLVMPLLVSLPHLKLSRLLMTLIMPVRWPIG